MDRNLKGYGKVGFRLDSRLPITLPILERILVSTSNITDSYYEVCLLRAMFSIAFYAFLRVGEITVSGKQSSNTPLQLHQVSQLCNSSGYVKAIKSSFGNYKHSYNTRPFSITVHRQAGSCSVQCLLDYLDQKGYAHGAFFKLSSGNPVPRNTFSSFLSLAIQRCGLYPSHFKGHSFRIGAASHAAAAGLTDAQIRILGRWQSDAFLKYIRVNRFSAKTSAHLNVNLPVIV